MERRDVGYLVAYVLSFVFFAVVGISFSTFKDKKQQVEVRSIVVKSEEGIVVRSGNQEGLNLSLIVHSPKVGTKPASGELDTQTDIPYTVTSQVGSEGAYAKFEVQSARPYKIVLAAANGIPNEELKNVKISIDGSEKRPFSAQNLGEAIYEGKGEQKSFTILVWLDGHTSNKIIGSKIDIELGIESA